MLKLKGQSKLGFLENFKNKNMCLVTSSKRVKKLKEPMTVYKLLTSSMRGPFTDFPYIQGRVYEADIKNASRNKACFDDIEDRYLKETFGPNWTNKEGIRVVELGFHSAETVERLKEHKKEHHGSNKWDIWECVIPAGSKYIKGGVDLIVSNKIVILKKV